MDLVQQQSNTDIKQLTNNQLLILIDFMQEWANSHSCYQVKNEILHKRKELIMELENRYVDSKYLEILK